MATVLINTDVGEMLYHEGDVVTQFVQEHGFWEKEEADVLREYLKPNQIFVDIGAHVGYFSKLAAEIGCTVLSFEPCRKNFSLLCENTKEYENVHPMRLAISDINGLRYLYTSRNNSGDNRLSAFDNSDLEVIFVTTLPSILRQAHFVKIDAQGDDYYVVRGMQGAMFGTILVEHWPEGIRGIEPETVLEEYKNMGYTLEKIGDDSKGYCSYLLNRL